MGEEKKTHRNSSQRRRLCYVNENNTRGVYHLLLQLVVFPVDQYCRFLENWGEKTQRRLSLECKRLLGGSRLEVSKCFRCRLQPLRRKQLPLRTTMNCETSKATKDAGHVTMCVHDS